MKKYAFILAAFAAIYSCQDLKVEISNVPQEKMSFVATMPGYSGETKTTFGAYNSGTHKQAMNWSATDKIDVYDASGNKGVFALTSGAGEASAVFTQEDEVALSGTTFYAIYPSNLSGAAFSDATVNIATALALDSQAIVENGYDPSLAIMTAVSDGGALSFTHGACYFGVQIPTDGITKIKIAAANNVFAKKPKYAFAGGTISDDASGTSTLTSASGSFNKGSYYYLCGIPRKESNGTAMGNVTITFWQGDSQKSITTTATSITSIRPTRGYIYDLGCPPNPFAPAIVPVAPSKIEADATSGTFTFTVSNPDGVSSPSVEVTDGDAWLGLAVTAITADDGVYTVHFTSSVNAGEERSGVITVSYTGATSKNVTITQKAAGVTSEDYVWDFSTTEWQSELDSQASAACRETNGNANTTFSVTYDGLTYTSGSGNGKWSNTGYIQPNGSGYYKAKDKRRYWTFTTENDGYVYVTLSGTGESAKAATVYVQQGEKNNPDWSSSEVSLSVSDTERVEIAVTSGDQVLFLSTGMQVKIIEFHQNRLSE